MQQFTIIPIQPKHNKAIATIIRSALTEFGANKPGTVFFDATTDDLFTLFNETPNSTYFIALLHNEVVGGAGVYPTMGLPVGTCELVKMYLSPNVRSMGLGKKMIDKCIDWAVENNYTDMYLETMPELKKAVSVYEKFGFSYLSNPVGNSGHTGCDIWMNKKLV